jgi:hypothetical protein
MRTFLCCLLLILLAACNERQDQTAADKSRHDSDVLDRQIHSLYRGLSQAFRGMPVDTDSLLDAHFVADVYYVTYWGTAEPIDTTKSRFRRAKQLMKDYENRVEVIQAKVSGDLGYAFFILRQSYTLNGNRMEEYLPTTFIFERRPEGWKVIHAQRSADLETTGRFFNAIQQPQR